jgi:hypothetical protein
VERLIIDNFSPKSENTSISSSFDPNATNVTLVVPEVGLVMLAENWGFMVEKTRILSEDPTSIRLEDSDHKNQETEAASSGGRDITRIISRDRVARMLSLEGRTVAMYTPSGLGKDWVDARYQEFSVIIISVHRVASYTSKTVRSAFWRFL